MSIDIKYDVPIEVTKTQYEYIMRQFSQLVAGRIEGGKYYIKLWGMKYKDYLIKVLEQVK